MIFFKHNIPIGINKCLHRNKNLPSTMLHLIGQDLRDILLKEFCGKYQWF